MALSFTSNSALGEPVYISDRQDLILFAQQGWGQLGLNTCAFVPGGQMQELRIGERSYAKGLGQHANGELVLDVDGRYKLFEAEIGVQPLPGCKGTVRYELIADGQQIYRSGVVQAGKPAIPVSVPIQGVFELILRVDDAGDGINCDCANWADARLTPADVPATRTPSKQTDIAPFARVVTWDPERMDGARAGRTEEFHAEDLFLDHNLKPDATGLYNVPEYANGRGCIGLQWLERRYLKSVSIKLKEPVDISEVQVQGWVGESAWQGNWNPLTGTIDVTDGALTLRIDWQSNPDARLGFRKIRWVLPGPNRAELLSAITVGRWATASITLQAIRQSSGQSGEIEIYNGEITSPAGDGLVRSWNLNNPLTLEVRHSLMTSQKSDRTVLRLRLPQGQFAVALDDVLNHGAVWVRDYGLYVTDASRPVTFQDYEKKYARRKTILSRVKSMPDQTLASAMKHTHRDIQNNGPTLLSLACDNHKFIVGRDGTIQFEDDPTKADQYVDAIAPMGREIKPVFGRGQSAGFKRQLSDGWLPAPISKLQNHGIEYNQRTFVAPAGNTGRPVLLSVLTATNISGTHAQAHIELQALDNGRPFSITESSGHRWRIGSPEKPAAQVSAAKGQPLTAQASNGALRFDGELKPGESVEVILWIDISPDEDIPQPDADQFYRAFKEYWQDILGKATQVDVPDPLLMNIIRASQVHCLIAARNADKGRLVAPWIASMAYGPLESEANSIIRGMDLLGHTDFARRSLDYFISKYTPEGMLTTGYTLMGEGWHLQTLGQHFQLANDTDWLRSHAAAVESACEWIVRQRDKTINSEDGVGRPEYGLLPPGVCADWNAYAYHFALNGYYYAGLHLAALALGSIHDKDVSPSAGRLLQSAAHLKRSILGAYKWTQARSPVVMLQDGSWTPPSPSQVHSPGPTGDFFPAEDGNRSWCYDVELGAHHLIHQGVLEPHSQDVDEAINYLEDVQFLSDGWFDYPSQESQKDWYNLGGFSKVQPYYTRNCEVYAMRDEVKPFVRSYFNTLASLINLENLSFWEHFHNVAAWNKTHETGYFLQQTRFTMIFEHGSELWLAPLVTSNWLKQGMHFGVRNAPTAFGPVSYQVTSEVDNGVIEAKVEPPSRSEGTAMVIRLRHPDGKKIHRVTINGKPHSGFDAGTDTVRVYWQTKPFVVKAEYQ